MCCRYNNMRGNRMCESVLGGGARERWVERNNEREQEERMKGKSEDKEQCAWSVMSETC